VIWNGLVGCVWGNKPNAPIAVVLTRDSRRKMDLHQRTCVVYGSETPTVDPETLVFARKVKVRKSGRTYGTVNQRSQRD
jgi:hypothetical protein